jgi:hypothetical protein
MMSNQELWKIITEAQGKNMRETTVIDDDGKQMKIKLGQTGWYDGYY